MDSQYWELAPVNDNFTKTHQAPLAEVLEHYAVMGVIAKMSIPPIESLRTAKKHFVVEQYMNNKGEKAEVYYIQINTADKKTYRINIVDVNFCHNLNFEVQWASNLGDNFKIRNPIEATVTANCVDYKPSQEERIQRAQPSYKGKLPLDQEWLGLEPQPNPEPPKKEKQKKKATPQRQVLVHPNLTLEQIKQINRQEAEQQPEEKSQESDLGDMGYEEDMRRLSMQPREVFLDYYEYTEVTKETLKVMLANWCKEDIDNSFTTKKQVEQFLQENGILLRKLQLKELLEETFDPLKVGRMNGFRLKQLFMKPHVREKVDKHLEQLVQFHQPRPKSKKYCKKGGTK